MRAAAGLPLEPEGAHGGPPCGAHSTRVGAAVLVSADSALWGGGPPAPSPQGRLLPCVALEVHQVDVGPSL